MTTHARPRRSLWMFGLESEEPSYPERLEYAKRLSERIGVELEPPRIPGADDLELRPSRIPVPDALAEFCFTDNYERAYHSYGADRHAAGVLGTRRTWWYIRAATTSSNARSSGARAMATARSRTAAAHLSWRA